MKNQDVSRQSLLRKSNFVFFSLTYLVTAISLGLVIFTPNNLAATDITHKYILLFVVLIIAAPAFSIGVISFRLRIEQAFKEKDLFVFMDMSKGSWGNPDISVLLGGKGKKALDIFIKIFFVIVVIVLLGIPLLNLLKI